MNSQKIDVIVIGSGPGGEGAAMQLSKAGKKVALVEKFSRIGGGCTHWGTIPSKSLRYAIYQLTEALKVDLLRSCGINVQPTIGQLRRSSESVIRKQEEMRQTFYRRNDVQLIFGRASFIDDHTIEVNREHRLQADSFVIATGSRPFRPEGVDFTHPRIFDSDTILGMESMPHSMTVYGAGVVGCEYASMFRNLDIKINLVNSRPQLLDFLDDEICDALSYHMRERGIIIRHDEFFEKIEGQSDGVVLYLKSGKKLKTDVLLWASGRTGNTQDMGLEQVGLQSDSRGYLTINEHFQTSNPHIYAVGDVIGFPSLASAAYTQGRAAANHMLGNDEFSKMVGDIPSGIYTSPEISSLGKTERELTAAKIPYEVGHTHFKSLARAQITGRTVGMLKLLFHRETLQILGIHCFGANASEIIHIGQAIMAQTGSANSLHYFMNTTFNYPTMAEAYRVAALNGYNRLF
jgi:NAD(P) transhydrogenase